MQTNIKTIRYYIKQTNDKNLIKLLDLPDEFLISLVKSKMLKLF